MRACLPIRRPIRRPEAMVQIACKISCRFPVARRPSRERLNGRLPASWIPHNVHRVAPALKTACTQAPASNVTMTVNYAAGLGLPIAPNVSPTISLRSWSSQHGSKAGSPHSSTCAQLRARVRRNVHLACIWTRWVCVVRATARAHGALGQSLTTAWSALTTLPIVSAGQSLRATRLNALHDVQMASFTRITSSKSRQSSPRVTTSH